MNSENVDPTVLKRGVLISVDRDGAKSLFGARGDDALRDFIVSLIVEPSIWSEGSAVDCQAHWRVIDQCLGEIKVDGQLQQCLLGGRPMYQGSELTVILVRPDLVPYLAGELDEVEDEAFSALVPADADRTDVHATFLRIRELYRSAAKRRHAIVFAVEN